MVNWIDAVIIAVFAVSVVLETKRGFGRALFDFAAFLVAVKFSPVIAPPIARTIHITTAIHANDAVWYAIVFAVLATILVLIGRFLYSTTLVSAEVFDALLGGLLGVGIGVILCHVFVRIVALNAGSADVVPLVVASSALGREFLTFESYHQLLETLYRFRSTE
jgi:uncharacterized membrane protein required for colicin V production